MSASVGIIYAIVEKAVEGMDKEIQKAKHRKCIVKDCQNHAHQGGFTGDLCNPCYAFISKGTGVYSQAYFNSKTDRIEELETKLAKAREVLEKIAGYDAQGWALVALAELKGEEQ